MWVIGWTLNHFASTRPYPNESTLSAISTLPFVNEKVSQSSVYFYLQVVLSAPFMIRVCVCASVCHTSCDVSHPSIANTYLRNIFRKCGVCSSIWKINKNSNFKWMVLGEQQIYAIRVHCRIRMPMMDWKVAIIPSVEHRPMLFEQQLAVVFGRAFGSFTSPKIEWTFQ